MIHERRITKEGLEENFAVNTFGWLPPPLSPLSPPCLSLVYLLGTYLLTTLLVPLLAKSADSRVVRYAGTGPEMTTVLK